jgi:hypothetical protein
MNVKRFILSVIVIFIILAMIDFLFDLFVLRQLNASLESVWRLGHIYWLEPFLYLVSAFLFMLIFAFATQEKGIGEGIFYGIVLGLFASGISAFKQYALYPLPLSIAFIWLAEGLIQYTAAGIAASLIYRRVKK